ncbi:hypothetical protein TcasGA2_TC032557 [Tribolium castaneum]|uniref:Peptidase S1 domain-containing protein n=1 Tax=Tribolium castaneum TaxID=7070 RepID=A0A139WKC7_TRICA|nr:PREDICTED: uncharacterized protein LOC103313008 isoform X1 [Tribolium castaneum]KYB28420.1 hypothetical protein TcasGA2_TC032557 [Tribolium castaneum]|eukprot:XP_008193350.1 PREDICTED: uncharacterized protein LOC103313008 isoform X1 [Tribolium castaneum]
MANFKTCVLLWFVIDVTSALDGTEDHTKLLTVKQILDGSVIRSCPGIDIYPHVVLTSAFCLRTESNSTKIIVQGPGYKYTNVTATIHPDYEENTHSDIGVIKINGEEAFKSKSRRIPLVPDVELVGRFGHTKPTMYNVSISLNDCDFCMVEIDERYLLCTWPLTEKPELDSGTPLFIRNIYTTDPENEFAIIAIYTNFNYYTNLYCNEFPDRPLIFTLIYPHLEWVAKVANISYSLANGWPRIS